MSSRIKKKLVKKKKKDSKYKYLAFILLFLLAWIPLISLFLSPEFSFSGVEFSIYNNAEDGTGLSIFRSDLEEMGYAVKPLYSSLSTLNKLNETAVLIIIGPSKPYDVLDTLALVNFIINGGNVLIADDFGSANTLLAPFSFAGFTIQFGPGVVLDLDSPYNENPYLPRITRFASIPGAESLFKDVSSIVLNYATFINGTLPPLAVTSPYSWADLNNNSYPDLENETAGPFTVVSAIDFSMIPFEMFKNAGRLVLISDPSLFINYMINIADNRIFARNIVRWLSHDGEIKTIIFDEGHLAYPPWSGPFVFSTIMRNITFLSSNWLLAPIFPFFAFYIAKRWLPKPKKEKKFKLKAIYRRRGATEFSELMKRIKETGSYGFALKILKQKWKHDLYEIFHKPVTKFELLFPLIDQYNLKDINKKSLRNVFKYLDKEKFGKITKSELSKIFFIMDSFITLLRGGKHVK